MASSKEYLDFILEQLSEVEGVTTRAMMGEYILYCRGRVVGGIYDDRLLVKLTPSALALLPDAARETLFVFDELTEWKKGNEETAALLTARGLTREDLITADSAEPKSIADYNKLGLKCFGAQKGPGSVDYSMKWLQSLRAIVIDPKRCPETYEEFAGYEYEKTRAGDIISGYPDANNHHIDAVRYATERLWTRTAIRAQASRPIARHFFET